MARDIFADLDFDWRPVSPKLAMGYRITGLPRFLPPVIIVVAANVILNMVDLPELASLVKLLAIPSFIVALIFHWIFAGLRSANWGHAEADQELVIKSGLLVRKLVVIPYGRMQFVDVTAGPIATSLGYASVTLKTASTETAATIPGVPVAEAHRLRDRLTDLGDSHASGI